MIPLAADDDGSSEVVRDNGGLGMHVSIYVDHSGDLKMLATRRDPQQAFPGYDWSNAIAWANRRKAYLEKPFKVVQCESELPMMPGVPMGDPKESNPKQGIGVRKLAFDCVPASVEAGIANALLSGALKYGRHNYRECGARASVYYSAARRHLAKWWDEGADMDQDTDNLVHHIDLAIAGLVVLRDAMICGRFTDDRPPRIPEGYFDRMSETSAKLINRVEHPVEPYTHKDLAGRYEPSKG